VHRADATHGTDRASPTSKSKGDIAALTAVETIGPGTIGAVVERMHHAREAPA
jgi:hypothetical protein